MAQLSQVPELKVFISYSRRDSLGFVDQLQRALQDRDIAASVDREDIAKSEEWWERIKQLITEADTIVFVLSKASVSSQVCQAEVAFAAHLNKRLIPVVASDIAELSVPTELARLNYIYFTEHTASGATGRFADGLDDLVGALKTDIGWVREHTRLLTLAERWRLRKRPAELLLRGNELRHAEQWLSTKIAEAPEPTDIHRAFIHAGRAAARYRQRVSIASAVIVGAVIFGIASFASRQVQMVEISSRDAKAAKLEEQKGLSKFRLERARALLRENRKTEAALVALEALPDTTSEDLERREWPLLPEARAVLGDAVQQIRERSILSGHTATVQAVTFSPDGKYLASSALDEKVIVSDTSSGNKIAEVPVAGLQAVPVLSPDGRKLLTNDSISEQGKIWDIASGKQITSTAFPANNFYDPAVNDVGTLAFKQAIWGSTLEIWAGDVWGADVKPITSRALGISETSKFAQDGDGRYFAIGSGQEVYRFEPRDNFRKTRLGKLDGEITAIAVDRGGTVVVASSQSGEVAAWTLLDGKRLFQGRGDLRNVKSIAIDGAASRILLSEERDSADLIDLPSGKHINRIFHAGIERMEFDPGGNRFYTLSLSEDLVLWASATGERIETISVPPARVRHASFSKDGAILAVGMSDGTVRLLRDGQGGNPATEQLERIPSETATCATVHRYPSRERETFGDWIAEMNDTSFLASLDRVEPAPLLRTGFFNRPDHPATKFSSRVVSFAKKANVVATGAVPEGGRDLREVVIRDAKTGRELRRVPTDFSISGLMFSPDASRLAAFGSTPIGGEPRFGLWNTATGTLIWNKSYSGVSPITDACFDSKGQQIAAVSYDGAAYVWDASDGTQIAQIGHGLATPAFVNFSADGSSLIVSELHTPESYPWEDRETILRGRRFALPETINALVERAKKTVPRCLTPDERRDFNLPPTIPEWCDRIEKVLD